MDKEEALEIIKEMHEEGTGSRGTYYENFGSSIRDILVPLSELLEKSLEEHPELVHEIAVRMERGY